MYDIIGDIHGHYPLLIKMLKQLGYTKNGKSFSKPDRKVIFTGDIINRGPEIRNTINLVRNMVDNGDALCILGNHEWNAILFATIDKQGKFFQKHLPRYQLPLSNTLEEYKADPDEFADVIKWFRRLPFYLDLDGLRVVHGSWNDKHIETIAQFRKDEVKIKKDFLKEYLSNKELNTAVDELLKGIEFQLPKDFLLKDDKGIIRRNFRIKWWETAEGKTFKRIAFGNRFKMPAYTIPKELIPETYPYPIDAPPVFLGHYCLNKEKIIYQDNICCIDTCVVRTQKLTAYRWNGEPKLNPEHLIRL